MIVQVWAIYIRDVEDGNHMEKGVHRARTTETIAKGTFWGYIAIIFYFSQLLDHVNNWCISCWCHPFALCEHFNILSERELCSNRGRRVAEIACGGLEKFVGETSEMTESNLELELANMDAKSAVQSRSEFNVGKRFTAAELTLRIQPHYDLPVQGLSSGHPSVRKARAGMVATIAAADRQACGHDHPYIQRLVGTAPGSLRAQFLAVIHGATSAANPELNKERTKAMLASSSEVSIERNHALMHQYIKSAPHHADSFASIKVRNARNVFGLESYL